jgi:hypothetical protein
MNLKSRLPRKFRFGKSERVFYFRIDVGQLSEF